jgi:hypothetical protein
MVKASLIVDSLKEVTAEPPPQEVKEEDFNLNNDEGNLKKYKQLTKKSKKLIENFEEGVNLWEFSSEYAILDDNKKKILYYVQYKLDNILKISSITQIKVWRRLGFPYNSRKERSLASDIFFNHLLPKADMVVTDKLQTPQGKHFWADRIGDAFRKGLNVYAIDQNRKTITKMNDLNDTQKYWGKTKKYQSLLIGLTTKDDLSTGL